MKADAIILRKLQIEDLEAYERLTHPSKAFHRFNGPYFKKETAEDLGEKMKAWRCNFLSGNLAFIEQRMVITALETKELIGEVSWYWKSQETDWMEVGIVIFNEAYWGKGIGMIALKRWIDLVFESFPQLVRIGLTTWSGNVRMMGLAEKLGMKKEAVYRKARIVEGDYYDSVSYGVLKAEWLDHWNNHVTGE
ncbi:MAG: GNAT family N-acetyltransferase [Clostridia bacterium]|nr:GNAT family N-acetyltransferase [Clostridia bacterium]